MPRAIHEAQPGTDPVVLVDVDGVLLVQSAIAPPHSEELFDPDHKWSMGYMFPAHHKMLADIGQLATPIWMTTHHDDANRTIGPALDLPAWDWVHLPGSPKPKYKCSDLNAERIGAIDAYFSGRPVVWIDDDVEPEDYIWLQHKTDNGEPVLMIQPDSDAGLQQAHADQAIAWLGQLARA